MSQCQRGELGGALAAGDRALRGAVLAAGRERLAGKVERVGKRARAAAGGGQTADANIAVRTARIGIGLPVVKVDVLEPTLDLNRLSQLVSNAAIAVRQTASAPRCSNVSAARPPAHPIIIGATNGASVHQMP